MRPHIAALYAFARTADDIAESIRALIDRVALGDARQRVGIRAAPRHFAQKVHELRRNRDLRELERPLQHRHVRVEPLRREPRFQDLLKRMQEAVATMRDRSTALAEAWRARRYSSPSA